MNLQEIHLNIRPQHMRYDVIFGIEQARMT